MGKGSVCIDGFNLALPKGSGIATYGRNLLEAIEGTGLEAQVLFGPAAGISRKHPLLNEIAITDAFTPEPRPWRRAWATATARFGCEAWPVEPSDQVIWPARGGGRPRAERYWVSPQLFHTANRAFRASRTFTPVRFGGVAPAPDLMHWTTALPLCAPGRPNLYTVHDLIPLRLPHATLDNKRAFFQLMRRIARRADHIAVVSEATKRDLQSLFGVPDERVSVTWQAVSLPERLTALPEATAAAEVEAVFRVPWKGYFLFFGAVEPKKNLARVVEAYLASGAAQPLIVVGGKGWLEEDELALLKQARRDKRVRRDKIKLWEHLPFSMLVQLVRGARATLFPSLYEGFGLPVLESMLLGTPVITSTAGSLPEVAGDAALSVDPYDTRALTEAIRALSADDDLALELATRGRAQAARFSPQAHRARLAALYARLGAG